MVAIFLNILMLFDSFGGPAYWIACSWSGYSRSTVTVPTEWEPGSYLIILVQIRNGGGSAERISWPGWRWLCYSLGLRRWYRLTACRCIGRPSRSESPGDGDTTVCDVLSSFQVGTSALKLAEACNRAHGSWWWIEKSKVTSSWVVA